MALEKDKKWLQEQAGIQELTGVPVKWPSSAKYKKIANRSPNYPDISPGMKCVVRATDRSVVLGYVKCVILSYPDIHEWYKHTKVIAQIVDYTHEALKERLGELICTNQAYWGISDYEICSFDLKDFVWLKDK